MTTIYSVTEINKYIKGILDADYTLRNGAQEYRVRDVLLVGGVGSNNYIRQHVEQKLAKLRYPVRLWVPEGRFSCDNATGCAAFARRINMSNK